MGKSSIGVYEMGAMGQNLVLNMMNHGYQVSVFHIDYMVHNGIEYADILWH